MMAVGLVTFPRINFNFFCLFVGALFHEVTGTGDIFVLVLTHGDIPM